MHKRWMYKTRWTIIIFLTVCIPTGHTQGDSGLINNLSKDQQASSLAAYSPPIQVSFVRETGEDLQRMIEQLPGETLVDNRWTRLYEQELGIQIRYDWIATGDVYNQKLGVSLLCRPFPGCRQS